MATTKELIAKHNELAFQLGEPELVEWKRSKDLLEGRIAGMQDELDAKAQAAAERLAAEAGNDPLADVPAEPVDPLDMDGPEDAPAEPEPEAPTEVAEEPKRQNRASGGTVGKTIEALLMDASLSYDEVVNRVLVEHPDAHTSRRSVASVAAGLRKAGVDVPMRRRGRTGE